VPVINIFLDNVTVILWPVLSLLYYETLVNSGILFVKTVPLLIFPIMYHSKATQVLRLVRQLIFFSSVYSPTFRLRFSYLPSKSSFSPLMSSQERIKRVARDFVLNAQSHTTRYYICQTLYRCIKYLKTCNFQNRFKVKN